MKTDRHQAFPWKISFVRTIPLYPVRPVVLVEGPAAHERGGPARDGRQVPAEGVGAAEVGQRGQLALPPGGRAGGDHPRGGRHPRRGGLAYAHDVILLGKYKYIGFGKRCKASMQK